MRSITGNIRRATQDMDFDFLRYSLSETSIRHFIDKLNCIEGVHISIEGNIEELSQQEYKGKRVYVAIIDDTGHTFKSKIDLGVHKNLQMILLTYLPGQALKQVFYLPRDSKNLMPPSR